MVNVMKIKIFTIYFLIISIFPISVSAEQSKAEEYRQIFKSNTFYIEYKDEHTSKIIAAFNNKRAERTNYFKLNWATYFNPLGALFGGSGSKFPEVLYQNGKYYQFVEEDVAIVLSDDKLNDENLDPRQGWNNVKSKLAVPNELLVFCWNDSFNNKADLISAPKFSLSTKMKVNEKEYDCDEYISNVKMSNSGVQILYKMLYLDGNLVEAHSSILQGGKEYPINKIKINKLQGEVPKNAFKVDKKTKVYEAGMGDMLDLIAQPAQVETLEAL